MQKRSDSPRGPSDLCVDFCGALEGYAVTGEATKELDSLCGKLWNCTDVLPKIACDDAQVPVGSTYARAAQTVRREIKRCHALRAERQ